MIKLDLNNLKLKNKLILIYSIVLLTFVAFIIFTVISFIQALNTVTVYDEPVKNLLLERHILIPLLLKIIISFLIVVAISIYSITLLIRQIYTPINNIIDKSKHIRDSGKYNNIFQKDNYPGIIHELHSTLHQAFTRILEFDYLKSNRIATNSNIVRNIINDINEGIVIIDENKITKKLNNQAEQLLRLNSGEVVNRSFVRYVNNTKLNRFINKALKDGSNNVDEYYEINKGELLLIDILTYLDKEKGTAGVVLVIKEKKSVE